MQDNVISIGAPANGRQYGGWVARYQASAERQLGHVASRLFSSAPVGELIVVSIVSIFLLRGSG